MNPKRYYKKRRPYRSKKLSSTITYRNPLGRGISNVKREFRFTVEAYFDSTAGPGTFEQYVQDGIPLNNPLMYLNAANTWTQIPNLASAHTALFGSQALFDQYKVMALTVRFIPNYQLIIGSTGAYAQSPAPSLLYQFNDPDDITQATSGLEDSKFMNSGKFPISYVRGQPITFRYVQPKNKRQYWLNAQSFALNPNDPAGASVESVQDMPNKAAGMRLVHVVNSGSDEAGTYYIGRIYCQWDCIFKAPHFSRN